MDRMEITQSSKNKLGMPLVGYGTYQISKEESEQSVKLALESGFRHIDSAEAYNNEEGTGAAIKNSGIARDEIFITTKVFPGNKLWGMQEKNYEDTLNTLKSQLQLLNLDYVDLYLIHAPLSELRLEQWRALVELKKMGLTKHIGVSNYDEIRIREILDAGMDKPETNQIEFHPLCAQVKVTEFMKQNGIEPIAYSSLAPLSDWRKEEGQGGGVLSEKKEKAQSLIHTISKDLNVSEAKLLLRWALQKGYAILTKSTKEKRMKENFDLFSFSIPEKEMAQLDGLNLGQAFAWAANGLNPMEVAPPLK